MKNNKNVLIINGPNLNMLGAREPNTYGNITLETIKENLLRKSKEFSIGIDFYQSNSEGEIVTKIQESLGNIDGLIINPAAYTHTSIAIRDSVLLHNIPVIEVHLSNIYKRESFRQKSYFSDISTGQITGFGAFGYELALSALINLFQKKQ